jgi:hypothetical protein
MWMLWLIPVMSLGFAVAVFRQRVIREAPQYILPAQTTELIPLLLPQAGSPPEKPLSLCADCWGHRLGAERMSLSPSGFGRSTRDLERCTGRRGFLLTAT